MSNEVKSVTRHELYNQVWTKPMSQLCFEYSLSDVGLAKICRKHNIPRPYLGYWAKKAAGKKAAQTKLPNPESNPIISITIYDRGVLPIMLPPNDDGVTPPEPVVVSNSLRGCHSLVSNTRDLLERAKAGEDGLVRVAEDLPLAIRVSKQSLHRSLLLFDAMLRELIHRGYPVGSRPTVTIDNVEFTISITEYLNIVKEEPQEHNLTGRYSFGHSFTSKRYVPSGNLYINIVNASNFWRCDCRATWRDGKRQKLEDQLSDFIGHLYFLVNRKKLQAAQEQLTEQKRQEEEKRENARRKERARINQLIMAERSKVEHLVSDTKDWITSRDIRAFVSAKRNWHLRVTGNKKPDDKFNEWSAWALAQADRIDPLAVSPQSILDKAPSETISEDE